MLINAAISGEINVIKKVAEKILQNKELTTEIRRMWNVKAKVIPVTTGTTENILKSFSQYLSNKTGKHEIKELQKQPYWALHPFLDSANVVVQNILNVRSNTTCSINCKYKTATTQYTL